MLTHERRAEQRSITIPQFQRFGLDVTPFIGTGQPSPVANGANGARILQAAHAAGVDLLIVEDDVDLSSDFPQALTAARARRVPVTLWLCKPHNHPAEWRRAIGGGRVPATGFYAVERLPTWFGTQALYLPRHIVAEAVAAPMFPTPNTSLDYWLRDHVLRTMLSALPNPVQHRNPSTLVDANRLPRISPTYHLERRGEWPSSTTPI